MIRRAGLALSCALGLGCYHVGQLVHLVSSRRDAGAPPIYADQCSRCHGDAGLSASMAPHADLSDEQLDALVAWIRAVGDASS